MIILQVLAFLWILILLCDSIPVSQKQEEEIQRKRFKLNKAKAGLKKLKYKQDLRNKSQDKATEEKMSYFNSNRSKWIDTQIKQEKLEGNVRRHNLAAKLIRQHFQHAPEISDALNHRADSLQTDSKRFEQRKDKLKKKGKQSQRDYQLNFHHENHVLFSYGSEAKGYQQTIDKNTDYLAKHDSRHNGGVSQYLTSRH